MKIILHVNQLDRWSMALGNIENLLNLDPKITLEMLVHGEAIINYTKEKSIALNIYDKLKLFSHKGVRFTACNNTLKKLDISSDQLCEFIEVVPAGVMELAKKQSEGFCYIKP
ncbi:DsrE family protein [Paraclostridium sordellii]|uniref:DsrE family protein n=1 Tax=Paraclostridium sordellii TaxID=1505 RepID=UPI001C611CF6|nr:DsrE family protein [Paeniclostridium sordellii]QYE97986.1 DsrE family protein [Paeniclostridium sordellii]